jgi:hypothetical protein
MLVPELIRRKNRLIKTLWITLIERRTLEGAAAVHTTSEVEARHISGFGWRIPTIEVIPNGVEDPLNDLHAKISKDVAVAIASGPFVLAFGRISWEKGLDRLLVALPNVPHVRLVIAGNDPDLHSEVLKSRSTQLALGDRVSFITRHVDGRDKEELFREACAVLWTAVVVLAAYGTSSYFVRLKHALNLPLGERGFRHAVASAGALQYIKSQPAIRRPGTLVIVTSPEIALELPGPRVLSNHADFETEALLRSRAYRGKVQTLIVVLQTAFLYNGKADAILESFKDYDRDRWHSHSVDGFTIFTQ